MAKIKLSQLDDETLIAAAKIVAQSIGEPDLEITPDFIRQMKIAAISPVAVAEAFSARLRASMAPGPFLGDGGSAG